ncbi:MAG: exonuclease domain-containing protein [Pseudomonadales bacterium]
MLLDRVCAVVDLETTGTNAGRDGITEVGALLLDTDGAEHEFQTLLNPYISIPPYISSLTGITNAMVSDSPGFEDIAPQLWSLINDTVFIAHNARFDYAFLKHNFAHCGYRFRPNIVCTVKLARRLFPEWSGYSLGKIITRINYHADDRHRAMADVQATRAFLQYAIDKHGLDAVNAAAAEQLNTASIPSYLDNSLVQSIPDSPGVYYFYGEDESLLYVGKSKTMRTRVKSHFGADVREPREMRMAQEVRNVNYQVCAGELGALLLENHDIKSLQPIYNRRQRPMKKLWTIKLIEDANGYLHSQVKDRLVEQAPEGISYGIYSSKRTATNALRTLADEHSLCKKLLGLESGKGACFGFQLKKCHGACTGQESTAQHNVRLQLALENKRVDSWPYEGDVLVCETNTEQSITDIHAVSNWAYLGSWRIEEPISADQLNTESLEQLDKRGSKLTKISLGFDKDTYRILHKFMIREHCDKLTLKTLPATELEESPAAAG